jgi:hypothetical protein
MQSLRFVLAGFVLVAALCGKSTRAEEEAAGPATHGLYTSPVYEDEAAMLRGDKGSKHRCVWKGREKKEGKTICRGGVQLRCGSKGWYKTGAC